MIALRALNSISYFIIVWRPPPTMNAPQRIRHVERSGPAFRFCKSSANSGRHHGFYYRTKYRSATMRVIPPTPVPRPRLLPPPAPRALLPALCLSSPRARRAASEPDPPMIRRDAARKPGENHVNVTRTKPRLPSLFRLPSNPSPQPASATELDSDVISLPPIHEVSPPSTRLRSGSAHVTFLPRTASNTVPSFLLFLSGPAFSPAVLVFSCSPFAAMLRRPTRCRSDRRPSQSTRPQRGDEGPTRR